MRMTSFSFVVSFTVSSIVLAVVRNMKGAELTVYVALRRNHHVPPFVNVKWYSSGDNLCNDYLASKFFF